MTVAPADFRASFPEFTDTSAYPDSQIAFWLGTAANLVSEARWGDIYSLGIQLFTAHNLVIAKRRQKAAAGSAIPGVSAGVLSSKSVDKVSASYDTTSGTIANGGAWNLTDYGVQYLQLAQLVGAGGLQI